MTKNELNTLLKPFNKSVDDLDYCYDEFKTAKGECTEGCPNCTCENDIKQDGTSTCVHCGEKEVLPCSVCPLCDLSLCDWEKETICSAFPKSKPL